MELAEEHMRRRNGRNAGNQYAPMTGLPSLRAVIATRLQQHYGRDADPETEITVTAGGTEALFCAISALVVCAAAPNVANNKVAMANSFFMGISW